VVSILAGERRRPPRLDRGAVARAVAAGVVNVPGVVRLDAGSGVEVATYWPGGRTIGVVLRSDRLSVHVVVDRLPLAEVAGPVAAVATTVLRAVGLELPVEVVVAGLESDRLPPRPEPPRPEPPRPEPEQGRPDGG
jgi:hypothetical protein